MSNVAASAQSTASAMPGALLSGSRRSRPTGSASAPRSNWRCLNSAVAARVRLEKRISFSRTSTSMMSFGISPRALHRSTWKASVSM